MWTESATVGDSLRKSWTVWTVCYLLNYYTPLAVASTRVQGWGDEPREPTVRLPDWSELVASYSRMKSAWGWANVGQPILVCYIRKYVIILGGYSRWRPPNQNIGGGMCPRHPRRRWRQCPLATFGSGCGRLRTRRGGQAAKPTYLSILNMFTVQTSSFLSVAV